MARRGEFYAGSTLLQNLVPVIGLPLDQLNFLVCQMLGLALAFPFQQHLSPSKVGPRVRLIVELCAGLGLAFFCFGHQVVYLAGQSLVSYLLMRFAGPRWSQIAVFVYCMGYLSMAHILRQYYDYGGYTLDITGPLMIQTQKLTSLAFALSDGQRDESTLSKDQKDQRITVLPDLLSFFSYMFYFHGIMVGPLAFYSDYMAFIEGTDVAAARPPPSSFNTAASNGYTDGVQTSSSAPAPPDLKNTQATMRKLALATVCGVLMVTVSPILCPPEGLSQEWFFEQTFLQRLVYVLVCTSVARLKYYLAWILGETLNIAAGFGFNGYDSHGEPKWDLNENVNIWGVEFANSLKTNIDAWNKKTLIWLRRVVYDRAPMHQTFAVFAVSAFWHGFYPGYYLTFATATILTIAGRLTRRNVRPWFQTSDAKRQIYDIITFMFTRYANVYICFPFLTLELMTTLRVYASLYFWMHLCGIAAVVYFTVLAPPKRKSSSSPSSSGHKSSTSPSSELASATTTTTTTAATAATAAVGTKSHTDSIKQD